MIWELVLSNSENAIQLAFLRTLKKKQKIFATDEIVVEYLENLEILGTKISKSSKGLKGWWVILWQS